MRRNRLQLTMLVGLLCALTASTVAVAGWFTDMDDIKKVSLAEVLRNPHEYYDVKIELQLYFHQEGDSYNPYYTRFNEDTYQNFSAWPIDARLYEKRDFVRSYPHFFVYKLNKKESARIADLDRVQPIVVVCEVREVFKGQPWIEVYRVREKSNGMSEKEVRQAIKGGALFHARRYKEAARSYSRAISSRPPHSVRADLHRRLADAHFAAGRITSAKSHYAKGLRLAPDSEVCKHGIEACNDAKHRAKMKRKGKQVEGSPVQPAPAHHNTLGDKTNGIDEIIRLFEDPSEVEAEVSEDRLDVQRRVESLNQKRAAEAAAAVVAGDAAQKPEARTAEGCGSEAEEQPEEQPEEQVEEQSEGEGAFEEGEPVMEEEPAQEPGCGADSEEGCAEGEQSGCSEAEGQPEEQPAVEVEAEPVVEQPAPVEAEPTCGCGIACGEAPEPVEETQIPEPAVEAEERVPEGPQKCLMCVAAGGLCAACKAAMETADETVDDGEAEAWVERTKGESEAAEPAVVQPEAEAPEPMVAEEPVEAPVPTAEAEEAEAERMLEDASKDEQAEPSEADHSESAVRTSDVHVDGRDDPADMPMTDEEHEELVQGDSNTGTERADPGEAPFYPSKDLPWDEVVRADPDAPELSQIEPESPYGARAVLVAGEKKQLPRLPFFGCDKVSAEDYAAILEEIAKEDS